jgi:RES domain-containing protein
LTLTLWRISGFNSLSGEGGLKYSARWHTAGLRIVYLAESPAGAMIEHLVHLELNEKSWPRFYDLMQVTAPDGIEVETLSPPAGSEWKTSPLLTRSLGDEWLRSKRTALARLPSAIMLNTWNFLLNPDHSRAAEIRIIAIVKAEYDPRLFPKR